jgi:ankyrin repeat protein
MLVENGADANVRFPRGMTLLHLVSEWGGLGGVRFLLECGSDVHALNDEGQTPFQVASENGHNEVMRLLLEHGAGNPEK